MQTSLWSRVVQGSEAHLELSCVRSRLLFPGLDLQDANPDTSLPVIWYILCQLRGRLGFNVRKDVFIDSFFLARHVFKSSLFFFSLVFGFPWLFYLFFLFRSIFYSSIVRRGVEVSKRVCLPVQGFGLSHKYKKL